MPRPDGMKINRSRCMLKVKAKADGSLDKFKARVIARGDQQEMNGMGEIFAPVFIKHRDKLLHIFPGDKLHHG